MFQTLNLNSNLQTNFFQVLAHSYNQTIKQNYYLYIAS
jgi:hypothetical protein